jgi:hypothetical protein
MRTGIKTISAGRRLGLVTSIITLLGGLTATAGGNGVIVNDTFDPPTIELGGWADGVVDVSREYVNQGVNGSIAVKISGEFTETWGYVGTMLYQNGTMLGNDRATLHSCQISLDVKVDRPGLKYLVIGMQSWAGVIWNLADPALPVYSSIGVIPLGAYTPGKFKTMVVPLDDPLWIQDPSFPGTLAGPFEPTGKTWQIFVSVDDGALPGLGAFAMTVDNVKVTTKNPLVPYNAVANGTASYDPAVGISLSEAGIAEHLGNYRSTGLLNVLWMDVSTETLFWGGPVVMTAENGDQLFGTLYTFDFVNSMVVISDGTGKFKDAVGSYFSQVTFADETMASFTGKASGSISTVGSNKQ